jgi:hypothetical protein
VDLPDEPGRKREARPDASQPVFEGRDVARNLDDIVSWNASRRSAVGASGGSGGSGMGMNARTVSPPTVEIVSCRPVGPRFILTTAN